MAGKIVTLAIFHDPVRAQLVRNRLEAEGIPTFLSGDEAAGIFGGTGATPVQLQVSEEHLRRALWLLGSLTDDDEESEELDEGSEDSTAITDRQAIRSPEPTELPLPESAVQASRPLEPVSEPADEEITTQPRRSTLQPADSDDIPDLRRRDTWRDIGWLFVLEVVFWTALLGLAIIGCCR
jgi:hypothetical protein